VRVIPQTISSCTHLILITSQKILKFVIPSRIGVRDDGQPEAYELLERLDSPINRNLRPAAVYPALYAGPE